MLLDWLRGRAAVGQSVPALAKGLALPQIATQMLTKKLHPHALGMTYLSGTPVLECKESRSYEESTLTDEMTLAFMPDNDRDVVNIGPALKALERVVTGGAQSVLHVLQAASNVAPNMITTPADVRNEMMYASWHEVDPDALGQGSVTIDYEAADEAVRTWMVEDCGSEDDGMLALPSAVDKELGGGWLDQSQWRQPKRVVKVTAEHLIASGMDEANASVVEALLNKELPAATRRFNKSRNALLGYEGGFAIYPVVITLGQDTHFSQQMLDDMVQQRMESGESDVALRIEAVPSIRTPASHKKGMKKSPPTPRPDSITVLADYINLLSHVDRLLLALRG